MERQPKVKPLSNPKRNDPCQLIVQDLQDIREELNKPINENLPRYENPPPFPPKGKVVIQPISEPKSYSPNTQDKVNFILGMIAGVIIAMGLFSIFL